MGSGQKERDIKSIEAEFMDRKSEYLLRLPGIESIRQSYLLNKRKVQTNKVIPNCLINYVLWSTQMLSEVIIWP